MDIDIEYNKDFKLYLSTSLSNPEYPPEDCIKLTIINFTVTFTGLQEQLLSRVVKMVSDPPPPPPPPSPSPSPLLQLTD